MDYTQLLTPQLAVLVGALLIIGKVIKESALLKDKYIPLLLVPFGIVGSFGLLALTTKADYTTAVIQGILAAGIAVYGNQVFKQLNKDE